MSHGDHVSVLPEGFVVEASTESLPIAAMSNRDRNIHAVQFHPEVRHSVQGNEMIHNFIYEVCGCVGDWTMSSFVEDMIKELRAEVGDKKVLCALSGGVDSSVVAILLHKAIGAQLTCMFIDHGLLRHNEGESVMETFVGKFDMKVVKIDAKDRFLGKLAGVADPEQKRKIIGTDSFACLKKNPASLTISLSWLKARCIRISWKVVQLPRKRSNRIITLAACRKI